jgi:hypothetical protein
VQLQLEGGDGPALLGLDVEQDVYLRLHLVLLPLELLLQHLQLLVGELLLGELLAEDGVAVPAAVQLHLQALQRAAQVVDLRLHVGVLVLQFLVERLPAADLPDCVLELEFVVPARAVEVFLVLDPEHVELVVLLLLELRDGFLLEAGLLQQLALVRALLILQLLHLARHLPILHLQLPRLRAQRLVLPHDRQLTAPHPRGSVAAAR